MNYWWNVYARGTWQEEYKIIASVECNVEARKLVDAYRQAHPAEEVGYGSAHADDLFDNSAAMNERHGGGIGRIKARCLDYPAFWSNSGGLPPINRAAADWSIGFDAGFGGRLW